MRPRPTTNNLRGGVGLDRGPCWPPAKRERLSVEIVADIHEIEGGGYWADVPRFPGCVAQGHTVILNVKAARRRYPSGQRGDLDGASWCNLNPQIMSSQQPHSDERLVAEGRNQHRTPFTVPFHVCSVHQISGPLTDTLKPDIGRWMPAPQARDRRIIVFIELVIAGSDIDGGKLAVVLGQEHRSNVAAKSLGAEASEFLWRAVVFGLRHGNTPAMWRFNSNSTTRRRSR
jgi:hypothetical protein